MTVLPSEPDTSEPDTSERDRSEPNQPALPAGLLLAAGGGTRIGRPKALVPFHGEPLVQRGVRLLRRGGCDPVVVVAGAAGDEVRACLEGWPAEVVDNTRWSTGMAGSLQTGLAALESRASGAVVALVDQPLVAATAIELLIEAWVGGAMVAVATYEEQMRHPVLFDARIWHDVAEGVTGDVGARALLRDRPEWVQRVACDAVASPCDIDTMDHLRALEAEPDPNPPRVADGPTPKEPPWS